MVVDELIVELGLDPTKFEKVQKEAMESFKKTQEQAVAGGKEIEAQGVKVSSFFSGLKREAVGVFAAIAGGVGIKDLIGGITNLDAATGRFAKTLNMSASELSAWQGAAEQMGGSGAEITATLQGLSGAVNTFMLTGQGPFLGITTQLGVGLTDANGRLKTSGALLMEIADAVHEINKTDPARAAAMLSMIPGMNQTSINMMIDGRAAMQKMLDTSRDLGGVTEQSAAQAQEYQKELANLERAATSLGRTLFLAVAPGITAVTQGLVQGFRELRLLPAVLEDGVKNLLRLLPRSAVGAVFGQKTLDQLDGPSSLDTIARAQGIDALRQAMTQGKSTAGGSPGLSLLNGGVTRGDRNNNPGNIEYGPFAISHGATGTDGRFAIFPTKDAGVAAMDALLAKNYKGLTIEQIQQKWVGTGADPGYVGSMTRATGLSANSVPDMSDPAVRRALISGMARGEGSTLVPVGAGGAAAARDKQSSLGGQTNNTTTVSVAKLEVNSSKADAGEVAAEIPEALKRANWAASSNFGLTG